LANSINSINNSSKHTHHQAMCYRAGVCADRSFEQLGHGSLRVERVAWKLYTRDWRSSQGNKGHCYYARVLGTSLHKIPLDKRAHRCVGKLVQLTISCHHFSLILGLRETLALQGGQLLAYLTIAKCQLGAYECSTVCCRIRRSSLEGCKPRLSSTPAEDTCLIPRKWWRTEKRELRGGNVMGGNIEESSRESSPIK
jgi:hypothetical protein